MQSVQPVQSALTGSSCNQCDQPLLRRPAPTHKDSHIIVQCQLIPLPGDKGFIPGDMPVDDKLIIPGDMPVGDKRLIPGDMPVDDK